MVFLLCICPLVSCDNEPEPYPAPDSEGHLYYDLNPGGASYTVTGPGDNMPAELEIPATYNDLPVTAIEEYAFWNNTTLVSVKSIGMQAFKSCIALTSVTIESGVGIPNLHPLKNNGVF